MTWTPSRIAQLRFLWSQGQSGNEIARAMGLTRNQVIGKASRLGLESRPSPIKHKPPPQPGTFTLLDLSDAHCRFPLGGQKDPPRFFCGCAVAVRGASYCGAHMRVAYQPRGAKVARVTWAGPQMRAMG